MVFESALGRLALVCGLVAHAVTSLSVRSSAVVTLCAWIVSFAGWPCAVASAIVGGLRIAIAFS